MGPLGNQTIGVGLSRGPTGPHAVAANRKTDDQRGALVKSEDSFLTGVWGRPLPAKFATVHCAGREKRIVPTAAEEAIMNNGKARTLPFTMHLEARSPHPVRDEATEQIPGRPTDGIRGSLGNQCYACGLCQRRQIPRGAFTRQPNSPSWGSTREITTCLSNYIKELGMTGIMIDVAVPTDTAPPGIGLTYSDSGKDAPAGYAAC